MLDVKKNNVLVILDGWGVSKQRENNAIALAKTPNWQRFLSQYPHTLLNASSEAVGLPKDQMGNSEIGHLTLGAGRIIKQDLVRINDDINQGGFFTNPVLVDALTKTTKQQKAVHILVLLSDGGVHSHYQQVFALLKLAKTQQCKRVFLHIFLDGRDTAPKSAQLYIDALEAQINSIGIGKIATVIGRYYAMDRDNRWQRIEQAYRLIVEGKGVYEASSASEALVKAYARGERDEFVKATTIGDKTVICQDDLLIAMNFRADRMRQLTRALSQKNFDAFKRAFICSHYVCLTEYDATFNLPVAYQNKPPENTLGAYLAKKNLKQLRLAETEKYAHVTFFFNGGIETPFENEDRELVPSPAVATYDLKPEMSAYQLTEKIIAAICAKKHHLIVCNFANADMVGHTGDLTAAICAVETIDACLGKIEKALKSSGGEALITADHGNIEQMLDKNKKQQHTAHTTNPVPLLFIGRPASLTAKGSLANVAPSLLTMMALDKPKEMTAHSLLNIKETA